jgi:hypothetical protein
MVVKKAKDLVLQSAILEAQRKGYYARFWRVID